jgi:sirohydrochlorin ferrochelatase
VDALVARGATRIVVFPYFIAAGAHVSSDLPRLIHHAKTAYPDVEFVLTLHLGKCNGIKKLILDEVSQTRQRVEPHLEIPLRPTQSDIAADGKS